MIQSVLFNTHLPVSLLTHSSPDLVNYLDVGVRRKRWVCQVKAAAAVDQSIASSSERKEFNGDLRSSKKLRILVAGGGIGGLVFALAAKKKGFDVVVFERDLSAVRGEGQYRGPIQIQSSALAALEAIDVDVAEEIMEAGCLTGDRVNGLVDGISGNWYTKFDTFSPAVKRGLPVTRVISRMTLQQILAKAVGEDVILNSSNVIDFVDNGDKVTVTLANGDNFEGDVLVGADGIWSKVRQKLFGKDDPVYSGYTCYTGIADFVPADIESVGYRVFLGHKQYFVSSDVGAGKIQWYAFHEELSGGVDSPNGRRERLLKLFGNWCDNVTDIIDATDEDVILRRDIYDRRPRFSWGKGRVTLLGDAIHAMQPNMGQGGCMAIEDSYQLALELDKAWDRGVKTMTCLDVAASLKRYEKSRRVRVFIVHQMARMAAVMASTYQAYLGSGLGWLVKIPHPGTVAGRVVFKHTMPGVLDWVLGGYSSNLQGRPAHCRLADKASEQLQTWLVDDNEALDRTVIGEWFLVPLEEYVNRLQPIHLSKEDDAQRPVGSAAIWFQQGMFHIRNLQCKSVIQVTSKEGKRQKLCQGDSPLQLRPFDNIQINLNHHTVVSYRVKVMRDPASILRTQQELAA
ncbi:hypothetical protein QQ045_008482 [Rhodiola kirilowii]